MKTPLSNPKAFRGSSAPFLFIPLLVFLATASPGRAWVNQDFETGAIAPWIVTYGLNFPTALVVPPGPAPNTAGNLNKVHTGNYSCELFSSSGSLNHNSWARIEQDDTIPVATPWLSYWFAASLWGIHFLSNAAYGSDAYVLAEILVGGVPVYSQRFSWYDNAAALVDDGVIQWKHLPWTQYYVDLAPYAGQTATIRYTAYNCAPAGHYCYGYLDDAQWLNGTQVPTMTHTPTFTATHTPTDTACFAGGFTCTPTETYTPTFTPTQSPTPTFTDTHTPTITPTFTVTTTASFTPSFTPTATPSCVPNVWPNPFNPKYAVDKVLKIGCLMPGSEVDFYTLSGEKVRTIRFSFFQYGSPFTATWDGKNENGIPVSTGVYYYVIHKGDEVFQRGKVIVMGDG